MDKTYSDTTNIKYVDHWKGRGLIPEVTGVILAGGASSRMGKNKALLKVGEQFLIERVYTSIAALFHDVILVTNTADIYSFIPCPKVPDVYPGAGSIAGLHAGLHASGTERIFAVACDMPFLNAELIRFLCKDAEAYDAVVPLDRSGRLEPLHALYAKSALIPMQESIERGDKSIINLLDRVTTRMVPSDLFKNISGAEESFRNLNTPEEYVVATGCRVNS
ncbi:MAG: molybdenum cofactor guanylyltransferase [Desulfuromonadaceae bacterium]|nr:molybdenum cofactor guanylyltransferase [Desulfuromonadaceae bacterium]MDD2849005.1 molybdenum cofactor guanylyltransferase [Desulfuromonadaceae bacterium]MDD4131838.1 molybdenum cofactor guanylyltransferase [Desulfuromonadaceae bacterium]